MSSRSESFAGSAAPPGLISPAARRLMQMVLYKSPKDRRPFSATELSAALSISRFEFFIYRPKSTARLKLNYGAVPGFLLGRLPRELKEKLEAARIHHSCLCIDDLVRLKLQIRRRDSFYKLMSARLAPGRDAILRREAMAVYFCALDSGETIRAATWKTRKKYFFLSRVSLSDRTILRTAKRVDMFGGPELAPVDAYAPIKSLPRRQSLPAAE